MVVRYDERGKRGWERSDFLGSNRGQLYIARHSAGPYYFHHGIDDQGRHVHTIAATDEASAEWNPYSYYHGAAPTPPNWRVLGVEYRTDDALFGNYAETRIPLWRVAAVTSVLPAMRCRSYRAGIRRTRGQCVTCGYDLRATPDRCPECGTIAPETGPTGTA